MIHELFGKWKVWQLLAIVAALIVTATTLALAGPLAGRNP
jgi:hypothetical protein